jgi:glycosyltransferase involved in cell wall biosynthesis
MSRILITVPAWNEASCIASNVRTLHAACAQSFFSHDWLIEVADNGSSDETRTTVGQLARELDRVALRTLAERGKGLAIRTSWLAHQDAFDVYVFLDADLSADLHALPALIQPIITCTADIVIGSRYEAASRVRRSLLRSSLSKLYRSWQHRMLQLPVQDAQCGFKAVSSSVVRDVVTRLEEGQWLFDTELLALAVQRGFLVQEVPVDWVEERAEKRRSALRVWRDGWGFIFGVWRIRKKIKQEAKKLSTVRR